MTKKPIEKKKKSPKKHAKKFTSEVKTRTLAAWTAALGLVMALAWNSVFQSSFKALTDNLLQNAPEFLAPLISAVMITIFAIAGIMLLNRWAEKH